MQDQVTIPRLVVGGIRTGSGQATVAMGLIAALTKRGSVVQSFKVGPDLIDSAYLSHLSHRPCRNLDAWMLGAEGVKRSLRNGVQGADVAIVVGAHGLFDGHGFGPADFAGSTAEVAHLIEAPLVLVLNAGTMGETAAAIALGIRSLDPSLRLIGVIFNNVQGERRRLVMEDAVWERAKLPVLGSIPHLAGAILPTHQTTLVPLRDSPNADEAIEEMAVAVERHCDLDLIERLMASAEPVILSPRVPRRGAGTAVRIGVAFDDAFSSYYAENLELLEEAGAAIVAFSPLEERAVPRDVDALYFGGGMGEKHVAVLAQNGLLLDSLRRAHAYRMPIYAECGGMALLAKSVQTSDGAIHAMTGLVPVDIGMNGSQSRMGYRTLRITADCLIGSGGDELRGYEFHSNTLVRCTDRLQAAYAAHDSDGEPLGPEGWSAQNLLASFVHLHFGQGGGLAERFVNRCRDVREQRAAVVSAGA